MSWKSNVHRGPELETSYILRTGLNKIITALNKKRKKDSLTLSPWLTLLFLFLFFFLLTILISKIMIYFEWMNESKCCLEQLIYRICSVMKQDGMCPKIRYWVWKCGLSNHVETLSIHGIRSLFLIWSATFQCLRPRREITPLLTNCW